MSSPKSLAKATKKQTHGPSHQINLPKDPEVGHRTLGFEVQGKGVCKKKNRCAPSESKRTKRNSFFATDEVSKENKQGTTRDGTHNEPAIIELSDDEGKKVEKHGGSWDGPKQSNPESSCGKKVDEAVGDPHQSGNGEQSGSWSSWAKPVEKERTKKSPQLTNRPLQGREKTDSSAERPSSKRTKRVEDRCEVIRLREELTEERKARERAEAENRILRAKFGDLADGLMTDYMNSNEKIRKFLTDVSSSTSKIYSPYL